MKKEKTWPPHDRSCCLKPPDPEHSRYNPYTTQHRPPACSTSPKRAFTFPEIRNLVQKLQVARQSLQLPSALAKLDRFDLIILDDLSYVRKDQAETSVLFELIAERYERKSLLITANQPFSGWHNVFPDPGMTVAAIDRLVHHSTIFELNVQSYRRREASDKRNARRRQLPDNHDEGAATPL